MYSLCIFARCQTSGVEAQKRRCFPPLARSLERSLPALRPLDFAVSMRALGSLHLTSAPLLRALEAEAPALLAAMPPKGLTMVAQALPPLEAAAGLVRPLLARFPETDADAAGVVAALRASATLRVRVQDHMPFFWFAAERLRAPVTESARALAVSVQ